MAEAAEQEKVLHIGNLVIDKEKFTLRVDDDEMMLPRKEFELLSLLVSKPDKVFLRDEIYKAVWGDNVIVGDRTIDVHIRKLREKIGNDHIRTLKGIGLCIGGSLLFAQPSTNWAGGLALVQGTAIAVDGGATPGLY